MWLSNGSSTLDLFGRGFVLLSLRDADAPDPTLFTRKLQRPQRNLPLSVVDIHEPEVLKAYERRLVLVRPDGHVAWRGDEVPQDPILVVDCVRGALGREERRGRPYPKVE